MKKLIPLIITIVFFIGCEKKEIYNFNDSWWHGYTYGNNTTMNIKFISDTEFKFEDFGHNDRDSYLSGTGKYIRNGNVVTFDFQTQTASLFGCANMKLVSGEWDTYPIDETNFYKAKLKVKYIYWYSLTSTIETEKEEYETTLTVGKSEK